MDSPRILPHRSGIYHLLSRLYEPIFTRVFGTRIHETIQSLDINHGAKILEVGVGTGLSLQAYPATAAVTGIDLSPKMLAQARRKVDRHGWSHVSLHEMDALNLAFENGDFDFVMAFHVATVVPDHERLIREMIRVCKPGGTIVLINHFRSERRWLASLVDLLDPFTRRLGWRTTVRLGDLVEDVPLHIQRRFKTSARSLLTVVTACKTKSTFLQAEDRSVFRAEPLRLPARTRLSRTPHHNGNSLRCEHEVRCQPKDPLSQ